MTLGLRVLLVLSEVMLRRVVLVLVVLVRVLVRVWVRMRDRVRVLLLLLLVAGCGRRHGRHHLLAGVLLHVVVEH